MGKTKSTSTPHDVHDHSYWTQPPPNPTAAGEPIWVDVRLNLKKVAAVNTVDGSAFVDITVVFYWTDPRLINWLPQVELPGSLWGPKLGLMNALGDLQKKSKFITVLDPVTGRARRHCHYVGTVDNPMDLRAFPFDMDKIELKFTTSSHYCVNDNTFSGAMAAGKSYRLRPVCEQGEGKQLDLRWSGQIGEWILHGVSTKIEELPVSAHGTEKTMMLLSFHVTRMAGYYFWKALLPLYLLTALSMTTFHFETNDLAARSGTVSTYFLAAFAMLYVVGESLPKTDFLTKIDTVIVLTTISLALTGLASLVITQIHN